MRYQDWLRWGTLTGIFLIPFVAFIIADGGSNHGLYIPLSNLFFPFITGKNFAFRILVELTVLFYVLLALREPKYRPRGGVVLWTVLAFVAWMAIATIFSVDPIKSFWSNFERMEGYLSLLHMLAWFVVAGAVLAAEHLWDRFFNVSIAASALMGFDALMQLFHWVPISSQSGPRVDTTFGNATYLAVYLLIHIFLTLYMLARRGDKVWLQVFYGLALVLQVVGLYFTETRGALLGVVGGLIIAALWIVIRGRGAQLRQLRQTSIIGLCIIVVLVGAFFALRSTSIVANSNTLKRLSDISLSDRTTQSRFLLWNMVLKGAEEKPVVGWGQENFSYVFNKYYDPKMYDQEQWFDRAHNEFLDWLIAGGIPAFVLYVALYGLGVYAIWRSKLSVPEQAALFGLLAAYAFNNLFVFDNLVSGLYFFLLLAYLHTLTKREAPSLRLSQPVSDQLMAIAAPVVAGVLLVGGWALNAPGLARASVLLDALQTQKSVQNQQGISVAANRPSQENLVSFNQVLGDTAWPGNPLGKQEVVEQLFQFASRVAPQSGIDPQVKQTVFETTYAAGSALMTQRQGDARLELFMAAFLLQFGQAQEALKHFQTALTLSPKKQQILMEIAGTYIQLGQPQLALATFKEAFDLEQNSDVARIYYAAGLYTVGQSAAADKLLSDRFGAPITDNDDLLRIFTDARLFDKAAAIWALRVEKNPKDVQTHLGYASALFASGNKAATIAELKKIEVLEPSAAGQMEQLIKQIQDGSLKPQQ